MTCVAGKLRVTIDVLDLLARGETGRNAVSECDGERPSLDRLGVRWVFD